MTWTEFAFNVSHFLIVLPFHSLLATFQVSSSLLSDLLWSHCFGWNRSKVVYGPSFFSSFSFQFLPFSISFPKWSILTILHLYMACKMWKITALTWEISSWRPVEKFYISAFLMYYSLCNWIGEHEIPKPPKEYLLRIKKKGHKQAQKDMNEMAWHKMEYLIFSAMRMLFCTRSHHNVPYEKQQEGKKGSEPWNECPC